MTLPVTSWSELNAVRNILNEDYVQEEHLLTTDSDYSGIGDDFLPIGNPVTAFIGTYDGQRYRIDGLTINKTTSHNGLFGKTDEGVTLSNIILTNVNVSVSSTHSGALVGQPLNTNVIECYADGDVVSTDRHAGMFGSCFQTNITRCMSKVNATSTQYAGSLAGYFQDGLILDSCGLGVVTGGIDAGGLAGALIADAENCYSSGAVSGTSNIGGMVGLVAGTWSTTNCFWDTQTSGQASSAGTETGKTTSQMYQQATFTGWNFTPITGEWQIDEDLSYPELQWISEIKPIPTGINSFALVKPNVEALINQLIR